MRIEKLEVKIGAGTKFHENRKEFGISKGVQ
jgi:hypothetical protein